MVVSPGYCFILGLLLGTGMAIDIFALAWILEQAFRTALRAMSQTREVKE